MPALVIGTENTGSIYKMVMRVQWIDMLQIRWILQEEFTEIAILSNYLAPKLASSTNTDFNVQHAFWLLNESTTLVYLT